MRAPRERRRIDVPWRIPSSSWAMAAALVLAACQSESAPAPPPTITVSVSTAASQVLTSHQVQLTATVDGGADRSVTWSATAGSVDGGGLFTAPDVPGPVTITATSVACSSCSGTAAIDVDQLSVSVTPEQARVLSGGQVRMAALVTGWSDTGVRWSASAGSVDESGLFTAPGEDRLGPVQVTATSTADPARSATATVSVYEIPVLTLTTTAPIDSKDHYETGTLALDPRDGVSAVLGPVSIQIKGRGNSTWGMPKKPYKVKFEAKTSLLGMPADKEWALLANYADKTLMRNSVTLELGRRLGGLPWTPRSRFVELWLNGSYDGTYLLIETVKVAPDRVNIVKMTSSDVSGDALSGGYLLEIDQRRGDPGDTVVDTTRGQPFVMKDPSPESTEPGTPGETQSGYIEGRLQAAEDALYSVDFGYQAHWDLETLVDWYLVQEVVKNVDGSMFSSAYVSKDRGGKLRMGPLWDFDLAIGNANYRGCDDPEGWYVREQSDNTGPSYYKRLFEDPAFAQRVRDRWQAVKAAEIDTIFDYADETAASLQHAQQANFVRWDILDQCVWPNPVCLGNYPDEVEYMKEFLRARIAWMDANL